MRALANTVLFVYPGHRKRFVGIRVTEGDHHRIRVAASIRDVSVNEFVHKVVMAAVEHTESHPVKKKTDQIRLLLVRARNGGLGYRECGREFAKLVKKNSYRELWELRQILNVVDTEMIRREKFKPIFDWCEKHFTDICNQVPQRRRKAFAEGFLENVAVA